MGNNYFDVKINVNKKGVQHVRFEKGCSFENNGAIYRLNNDGKLAIFDKAKREWRATSEITMNSYQFNLFKAVANNTKERENGRELNGYTLSHADIQKALDLAEAGKLTKDLSEYLDEKEAKGKRSEKTESKPDKAHKNTKRGRRRKKA